MKKFTLLCAAMVAAVMTAKAEVEFAYDAGAEIVSAYIWRGQYNGGLSFQPDAEVGFNAMDDAIEFRAGVWANIGASDWGFRKNLPYVDDYNPNTYFVPEVDFMAHVTAYGASLGYNAYYYCNDGSDHTSELWFGYNFSHFFGEKAGAYINWYTTVGGGGDLKPETDLKQIAKGQLERQAFSTYIELGYDYTFENIGLTLGAQIGLSPWESPIYGNDQFACTNLSLKVNKEWEFEHVTLDVFALGSLNPDGVNNDNAFVKASGDDKIGVQKLNGTIGVGIWF
ncbi:MAG: hypothetical protein IJQ18_09725 [Paludibacteraceae bacterium]|nr:hypothetical protein [Paludibacteraceae bacterium]